MDRDDAVDEALRAARYAEAELEPLHAPRIHRWVGSSAAAAHDALADVDAALRTARHAADAYLAAARKAASDG